jgi:hypothetical protein
MFYIRGLLKMSQSVRVFYFSIFIRGKVAPTLRLTFVCLYKVSLVYIRVGAGDAGEVSKFLLGAEPHKKLVGSATLFITVQSLLDFADKLSFDALSSKANIRKNG